MPVPRLRSLDAAAHPSVARDDRDHDRGSASRVQLPVVSRNGARTELSARVQPRVAPHERR